MPEVSAVQVAWFALASLSVIAWVVLDGFDFGAAVLGRLFARTEEQRAAVLSAIGPFWDGNEVWLIAFGGTLYVAFPHALAVGLSGLYLPIIFMVWSLMG